MPEEAPVNIGDLLREPHVAAQRVLEMQTKLHHWAAANPDRRFDDLYNLVYDPSFMVTAWLRVKGNKGKRSAGIDGRTVAGIERREHGVEGLLEDLRGELRTRRFSPVPARERLIPKPNGSMRRLGIPTVTDRVVQAALKMVLEPIFEADFRPVSYGFRPRRRAQDAIEDIRHHAAMGYEWVLEGDIRACFDEIGHAPLMEQVRTRIKDKRVLALVKAFIKAGILTELGHTRNSDTGTPPGGILSPLLANIALSVLDDHFQALWDGHTNATARMRHRQRGGATFHLVRYADDFVVLVHGQRKHADHAQTAAAGVLAKAGLTLAPEKTQVCHIDEGFDFLGFRIQRHTQKGSKRKLIYSYPSKKSMATVRRKVKKATSGGTHRPLDTVLTDVNAVTRGWAQYFRHGSSSKAYHYLNHFTWWRIWRWLRKKNPRSSARFLISRYYTEWTPECNGRKLYDPTTMTIQRYRYRGKEIHLPWHKPANA